MRLFSGHGNAIDLGPILAKGGEGAVYEIDAAPAFVAKVYHHPPDQQKQRKLAFMCSAGTKDLSKYTAWPVRTLHHKAGGPVIGFAMRRLLDCEPVHSVYSPAERKQSRPKMGWDFLLHVARNTAAVFDIVHQAGVVIGDVNQNNVLVRSDSQVLLIDTDSYQIKSPQEMHICGVGVPHFTPPELQGISDFKSVTRAIQHDLFGLALLVFHLLCGGRHPYSGVPCLPGAGESLEEDIRQLRYAYAGEEAMRGMKPPPMSIPIKTLPLQIEGMFRYAFTEPGAAGQRPTALDWVSALDQVRGGLKRCTQAGIHVFPGHLATCPWCELDGVGVVLFIPDIALGAQGTSSFDLAKVWAAIEAVYCPPALTAVPPPSQVCVPRPLSPSAVKSAATPQSALFAFGMAIRSLFVEDEGRRKERALREQGVRTARQLVTSLVTQRSTLIAITRFQKCKVSLIKARDELVSLAAREKVELAALARTAEERQRRQFLERQLIRSASISGVGVAKKASLRSFGIETAADIEWSRVIRVSGFGPLLTQTMLDWRSQCESRFRFDPSRAVAQADRDAIRSSILGRRWQLETALVKGLHELKDCQSAVQAAQVSLEAQLQAAVQQLAQAEADMKVFA
jgi:DNA-binding helix-hairpin-helix protein with protein kinase domain